MTTYNKAVRDKIPEIIRKSGRNCDVSKLPDSEFLPKMEAKLEEEVAEYRDGRTVEELADILEVVYRISELRGTAIEQLEFLRKKKLDARGGFKENLFLADAE